MPFLYMQFMCVGVGEPPKKVKTAEAALAASTASGCNHYEALNSYRAASPIELKRYAFRGLGLVLNRGATTTKP